MSSRLSLGNSSVTANMVRSYVNGVEQALATGRRIKAILDSCQYGNPADWQGVATELGITDTAQAQAIYIVLSNSLAAIDVAQNAELSRLDQG